MRVFAAVLLGLLATAGPVLAEESASPHHMVDAHGELDMEKCPVCHEPDMSLSRSKQETCTLCHSETLHAGSYEHLHASAEAVKKLLSDEKEPNLPRTDDGGIFCGTCHIFHDPAVAGEELLQQQFVPPATGISEAVRQAVTSHFAEIAKKYDESKADAKFASEETRALRLPVSDGSLCLHCHKDKQ